MIPKKIHYCWFGGAEKPRLAKKCIKSWKKYCPDYEIIEWNESNIDIGSMPLYTRQAYEAKKWGFVPDYIRAWVVYQHGGIYLDTDVELVRGLDPLLRESSFFGFEDSGYIGLGLGFGAEAGNILLKEIMDDYGQRKFIRDDGTLDTIPSPTLNTAIFERRGVLLNNRLQHIDGVATIFPTEYFCPLGYYTGELKKTDNTYSIHWFMASWQTAKGRGEHKSGLRRMKIKGIMDDFHSVKAEKGFLYAVIWSIVSINRRKST